MHEAYEATSVIDRLPYSIESIAAYGTYSQCTSGPGRVTNKQ